MMVDDVYLLTLNEPYASPEHPVPINAVIVHALTLLNPAVPQPDGGMIYRCLIEFPGRTPGCLVPLSTVTYELDGGELWDEVADWAEVSDAVVDLARTKGCDAMMLGLPEPALFMLASGPTTQVTLYGPQGQSAAGGDERQWCIDELTRQIRDFVAEGPFWPGDNLVAPPVDPPTLPYKPFDS